MGTIIGVSNTIGGLGLKLNIPAFTLETTGTGSGVGTLRVRASETITLTIKGNARFYDDSGATTNESTSWTVTSGALQTKYLKNTSGSSEIFATDNSKIISIGEAGPGGDCVFSTNSPRITFVTSILNNLTSIRIAGATSIIGEMSNNCYCFWVQEFGGNHPIFNITRLSQALSFLVMVSNVGIFTSSESMPNGTIYINITAQNSNWTGLNVGNNGNISFFGLAKYRISKMSSADMVAFLTHLKDRTGGLPATITINDYADFASPPQSVVDAVAVLKLAKPNVTTVNLGA